jgi:hypothetical protein
VSKISFTSAAAQATFLDDITSLTLQRSGTAAVALATAAADMLNDPASPIAGNVSAAASIRASLLAAISSAASAAATPEALESVTSSVALLLSNPAQMNAAGANTALSMLALVCAAGTSSSLPVNMTAATANAAAAGLSSLATAALAPGTGVSSSVLSTLSTLTNSLADSLFQQLAEPGGAPLFIYSPAVQMAISFDPPGAGSRLFSQPLTANGSASSFAPMPAGLFDAAAGAPAGAHRRRALAATVGGGVRTSFASLTFDPFTLDPNSTGVTRLAFSTSDGAELPVRNLSTLIYFTLPAVNVNNAASAEGTTITSVCSFWDTTALIYSEQGCVGIPDPRPPPGFANFSWAVNFTTHTDAGILAAWTVTGNLTAGCSVTVLDCGTPNLQKVYPNPASPLTTPAVQCNASVSTKPMLVFTGSTCHLIAPSNAANCYWQNTKQAFAGPGCMPSGQPKQCACRHLTDLSGRTVPALPMASLEDMLSLNPADIVTKLKVRACYWQLHACVRSQTADT